MHRILGALALLLLLQAPAAATEVIADDTQDVYAISGAVLLNGSAPEAADAAVCTTCHWRVIRICTGGSLDERRPCPDAPCASSTEVAELWRADAPSAPPVGDPSWQYRGLICLTEPPIAIATMTSALREVQVRAVPALRPVSQPTGTTLTGLPTLFTTGQPAVFVTQPATVAGVDVVVRATAQWTWDFGHGTVLVTRDPGGGYPMGRVRHTYPKRGIYRVRVTCIWSGTYSARGLHDLPVPGDITQAAWFDLRVREARRFLR